MQCTHNAGKKPIPPSKLSFISSYILKENNFNSKVLINTVLYRIMNLMTVSWSVTKNSFSCALPALSCI